MVLFVETFQLRYLLNTDYSIKLGISFDRQKNASLNNTSLCCRYLDTKILR